MEKKHVKNVYKKYDIIKCIQISIIHNISSSVIKQTPKLRSAPPIALLMCPAKHVYVSFRTSSMDNRWF